MLVVAMGLLGRPFSLAISDLECGSFPKGFFGSIRRVDRMRKLKGATGTPGTGEQPGE
jgi:hypothetical protein